MSTSTVWNELIRYHNDIYAYIHQILQDPEAAEDICQDVFIQAYRHIDELQLEKNVRAWLYRVARNSSLNYIKSRNIRRHQELSDTIPEQGQSAYDDTYPFIEQAFSKLPERQQDVLRYREVDGYSYEDLATKMGLSVSAVTSLLSRARDNFQRQYLFGVLPPQHTARLQRLTNHEDILRLIDPTNPPTDLFDALGKMTKAYFQRVSSTWDDIRDHFFEARDLNQIFDRIDFNSTDTVLDLGTGTGFLALHVAPLVGEVIGIDINPQMLETAARNMKKLGRRNVSLLQGAIEDMPIYGRKFDVIFSNLVLHHLSEPYNIFRPITRLMNRDSKFVIVDFKRHTNKKMADDMKDIWLGFDPKTVRKKLIENTFSNVDIFTIKEKRDNIPEIFCVIATF